VAGEAAQDPDGFDRDAMHEVMNTEIVGFFDRKLGPGDNTPDKRAQLKPLVSDTDGRTRRESGPSPLAPSSTGSASAPASTPPD